MSSNLYNQFSLNRLRNVYQILDSTIDLNVLIKTKKEKKVDESLPDQVGLCMHVQFGKFLLRAKYL